MSSKKATRITIIATIIYAFVILVFIIIGGGIRSLSFSDINLVFEHYDIGEILFGCGLFVLFGTLMVIATIMVFVVVVETFLIKRYHAEEDYLDQKVLVRLVLLCGEVPFLILFIMVLLNIIPNPLS